MRDSDGGGEQGKRMTMINVTDVTCDGCKKKKVTKVSVAHKTVNSEPKNIILGSLESL